MAELSEMAKAILKMVAAKRTVSYAELSRIKGFKGDREILQPDYNLVWWSGLSIEAINAMEELRVEKLIAPTPTSILVYLCDGTCLRYPLAKSTRKYKKPHWVPLVFNPTPKGEAIARTLPDTSGASASVRS